MLLLETLIRTARQIWRGWKAHCCKGNGEHTRFPSVKTGYKVPSKVEHGSLIGVKCLEHESHHQALSNAELTSGATCVFLYMSLWCISMPHSVPTDGTFVTLDTEITESAFGTFAVQRFKVCVHLTLHVVVRFVFCMEWLQSAWLLHQDSPCHFHKSWMLLQMFYMQMLP